MKLIAAVPAAVALTIGFLNYGAEGALPLAHPGPTVNDYTGDQSRRAEAAARSAGFGNLEIVMVQDGNFFLSGEKQGEDYSLTVTPDGKVYSSAPLPTSKNLTPARPSTG